MYEAELTKPVTDEIDSMTATEPSTKTVTFCSVSALLSCSRRPEKPEYSLAPPPQKKSGSMFNTDPFGTAGGGSYVPAGMSKAEYDRIQAEGAAKKQANRNRKRGSNMSLAEAQRTGYKTFVSLKGDATAKESKKGWLNPFSDE